MDSILLINGKSTEGNEKTVAIVSWFLAGYNITNVIIGIKKDKVIIFASDRTSKAWLNIVSHLKEFSTH